LLISDDFVFIRVSNKCPQGCFRAGLVLVAGTARPPRANP
jgi:hypothetical protein